MGNKEKKNWKGKVEGGYGKASPPPPPHPPVGVGKKKKKLRGLRNEEGLGGAGDPPRFPSAGPQDLGSGKSVKKGGPLPRLRPKERPLDPVVLRQKLWKKNARLERRGGGKCRCRKKGKKKNCESVWTLACADAWSLGARLRRKEAKKKKGGSGRGSTRGQPAQKAGEKTENGLRGAGKKGSPGAKSARGRQGRGGRGSPPFPCSRKSHRGLGGKKKKKNEENKKKRCSQGPVKG